MVPFQLITPSHLILTCMHSSWLSSYSWEMQCRCVPHSDSIFLTKLLLFTSLIQVWPTRSVCASMPPHQAIHARQKETLRYSQVNTGKKLTKDERILVHRPPFGSRAQPISGSDSDKWRATEGRERTSKFIASVQEHERLIYRERSFFPSPWTVSMDLSG